MMVVTGSRLILLGMWFVALIVFYKYMGRDSSHLAEAGMFGTCIAFIKVLTACIGDSLDLAVLRRTPLLFKEDREKALKIFKASFRFRMGIGLVVALTISGLGAPLSVLIFQEQGFKTLIWIAMAGVVSELLFRYVLVYFQANERFGRIVLLEAILQIGRFVVFMYLVLSGMASVYRALSGYVLVSYLVAVIGIGLLPKDLLSKRVSAGWEELSEIFHYAKWMSLALVVAALYERLDLFLVSSFHGAGEAGLYSGLLSLAMIPEVVGSFISTILQPRVVGLYRDGGFKSFQRSVMKVFAQLGVVAGLIILLFGEHIVSWTLGKNYLEAIWAFKLLSIGLLFWLVVTPLSMALVALVTPKSILKVTTGQLILMLVGGFLLVPAYGYTGAAALIFIVRILIAIWLLLMANRILKKKPEHYGLDFSRKDDQQYRVGEPDRVT